MLKKNLSSLSTKLAITYLPLLFLPQVCAAKDAQSNSSNQLVIISEQAQKDLDATNMHQKMRALTTLADEQSTRIQKLRQEIKGLKEKLYLNQIANSASQSRDVQDLYVALKQESALHKETEKQLKEIINELKLDNQTEKANSQKAALDLQNLENSLASKSEELKKLEEKYHHTQNLSSQSVNEAAYHKELYEGLQKELANSKQTEDKLESLIHSLSNNNQESTDKLHKAEDQINTLLKTISDQTYALESLQKEHDHKEGKLSTFTDEVLNLKAESYNQEMQLNQYKNAKEVLEQLVANLKEQNLKEEQEHEAAKATLATMVTSLSEQSEKVKALEVLLDKEKASATTSQEDIKEHQSQLSLLKSETEDLNKSKARLEELIAQLSKENDEEKARLNAAQGQIDSLTTSLTEKENSYSSLKDSHDNLQNQYACSCEELDRLQNMHTELQHEKTSSLEFKGALEESQQARNSLADENTNLKLEVASLYEAKNKLNELVELLKEETNKLQSDNKVALEQNDFLKSRLDTYAVENDELHSSKLKQNQFVQQIDQELASLKETLAIQKLDLNSKDHQIEHYELALNFQRELIESRNSEIDQMVPKDEYQKQTSHIADYEKQLESLQEVLEKQKTLINELTEEQARYVAIENELVELQKAHQQMSDLYKELQSDKAL